MIPIEDSTVEIISNETKGEVYLTETKYSEIELEEIKFSATKKDLKEGIDSAFRYLPKKASKEYECQFRLSKENKRVLKIQAQEHNKHGFVCYIPADLKGDFDAVIDAKRFKEIVKEAPDEIIRVRKLEDKIEIRSGGMRSFILTGDSICYPNIEEIDSSVEFTIESENLARMIRKTSFATKRGESKSPFTACALHIEGNAMTMQASDTHQLAIVKSEIENENEGSFDFLIPATTLENMLTEYTFKKSVSTDLTIHANKTQIQVEFDNIRIVATLIDGRFPDFTGAIPVSYQTKIRVKRKNFLNTIKRIPKQTKKLDILTILGIKIGEIHIDSFKRGVQISNEILPCKFDGVEMEIGVDATFLKDSLAAMESEYLDIEFSGVERPFKIHEVDNENYLFVVSPMRINKQSNQ